MKYNITIDIPIEFESDLQDRFEEFFGRVEADIKDRLRSMETVGVCGNYEQETAEMLRTAFKEATILPLLTVRKER